MKKLFAFMLCGVFACCLALGGCAGQAADETPAEPEDGATVDVDTGGEMIDGVANPWSDVATAAEAAAGAGFDTFIVPAEDTIAGISIVTGPTFRCMTGIAQADYDLGAASICIRKGLVSAVPEGSDLSGDYTEYPYTWTVNVKGLEVSCSGLAEGASMKTLWSVDDTAFSISARGLGGDDKFGLNEDQINELVNSIQ